jgi:hypothetical protein
LEQLQQITARVSGARVSRKRGRSPLSAPATEELAKALPGAKVGKAFNTIFAELLNRRANAQQARYSISAASDEALGLVVSDPTPGPERVLNARQELAAIKRLFADDPTARKIIDGLREGLSAEQIRRSMGLSKTDYDSARRRMRRALLRQGLTCEPK